MAKLAVILLMTACLACLSQARFPSKFHRYHEEELKAVKSPDARSLNHKKRWLGATIGAISAATKIAQTAYDWYNGFHRRSEVPENIESPAEVLKQLDEAVQKMDQLSENVEHLMEAAPEDGQLQSILRDFTRDVQTLDDLTDDHPMNVDASGKITPDSSSREWSEAVLSEGPGGVQNVLSSIHRMIMGGAGGQPLLRKYVDKVLVPEHRVSREEIERMVQALMDIQQVGYSYWVLALDLTGQFGPEVEKVEQLMMTRMMEQGPTLSVDELLDSIQD